MLQKQVGQIIKLLTEEKYSEIELLTGGIRLPKEQLRKAIEQYGRKLITPPSDAYNFMDVVVIRGASTPSWSVTMPLWTKEEGRSDLSLELTIIEEVEGFKVEVDDIHVL